MAVLKCLILLIVYATLVHSLPECLADCIAVDAGVDNMGIDTTADCRCWTACKIYTPEAQKTIDQYHGADPNLKKVLYVRRDCKDAVMMAADVDHIDDVVDKLWSVPNGPMTLMTKEDPGPKSVSSSREWLLLEANYFCPINKQSHFIRHQLNLYRNNAVGGRALYFHRDCNKIRYVSGKASAEEASQAVVAGLKNAKLDPKEWFLYDWSKEGQCSPLTHRHRKELRDLTQTERQLWFDTLRENYRRGLWHIHAPYHAQLKFYNYAHGTPAFLLWHRFGMLQIEEMQRGLHARTTSCITIPYWSWPNDADDGLKSPLFTDDWLGSAETLLAQGKDHDCGQREEGCCVNNGQVAGWTDFHGECIRRNFAAMTNSDVGIPDGNVITDLCRQYDDWGYVVFGKNIATFGVVAVVLDDCLEKCGADESTCNPTCHNLITTRKNRGFSGDLELSHSRVHFAVGGQMFAAFSPADPIFVHNHGFVDKVWDRWALCNGYTKLEDYWITKEEHFSDSYSTPGPYGLSDRIAGWQFTLRESGTPFDMAYTSYDYALDPWEVDNKLSEVCKGWHKFDTLLWEPFKRSDGQLFVYRSAGASKIERLKDKILTLQVPSQRQAWPRAANHTH